MYYGIRHCWRSFVYINPFLSCQLFRNRWGNGGTKDLVTFPIWANTGLNEVSVTYNLVLTSRGLFTNERDLCLEREVSLSQMAFPTRQGLFRRTSYVLLLQMFSKILWQFIPRSLVKGLGYSLHQVVESVSLLFKLGKTCELLWLHQRWVMRPARLGLKTPCSIHSCHLGALLWGHHIRKPVQPPGGWEALWSRTEVPQVRARGICQTYLWVVVEPPGPANPPAKCSQMSEPRWASRETNLQNQEK